jgi:Acylphosphatases
MKMGAQFIVHGFVQGVGYRSLVKKIAERNGLCGFVRNLGDGSVEIFVEGNPADISRFEMEISVHIQGGPDVYNVHKEEAAPTGKDSFVVEKSR